MDDADDRSPTGVPAQDDPDDDRAGSPDLLDLLRDRGATREEVLGRTDTELIALSGDLVLGASFDLTLEELAERAGATVEQARRMFHSLGLDPDELGGFGEGDVAALRLLVSDASGIVDQVAPELLRVTATSLRRIAEAAVAAYVQDVENHPLTDHRDPVHLAELNALASGLLVEFSDSIGTMFRHHMWVAVRRQRTGQHGVMAPQLIRGAVGFVDLVGYTPIARSLSPAELSDYVEDFERRAFEVAHQHGGRIVKSIGDEVMFTAPEPAAAAAIALELVASFGDDAGTRPRGGLSAGEVLFRLGDLYGPVVNTAARLVDAASPGQVLTDVEPASAPGTVLDEAGTRQLKGFDEPVRVRSVRLVERAGHQGVGPGAVQGGT